MPKPPVRPATNPARKPFKRRPATKPPAPKVKVDDGTERLHAYIAHSGLCSRRAAEKLILEGRVEVNGELVLEMGVKVGPDDEVRVDGQPVRIAKLYTVLLNKPTGVVTTLSDPQRRTTIVRYLPDMGVPLKPVGRLDMRLIKHKNDYWVALGFVAAFVGVLYGAMYVFGASLIFAIMYLLAAFFLYWPIRLIVESFASLVARLLRR